MPLKPSQMKALGSCFRHLAPTFANPPFSKALSMVGQGKLPLLGIADVRPTATLPADRGAPSADHLLRVSRPDGRTRPVIDVAAQRRSGRQDTGVEEDPRRKDGPGGPCSSITQRQFVGGSPGRTRAFAPGICRPQGLCDPYSALSVGFG